MHQAASSEVTGPRIVRAPQSPVLPNAGRGGFASNAMTMKAGIESDIHAVPPVFRRFGLHKLLSALVGLGAAVVLCSCDQNSTRAEVPSPPRPVLVTSISYSPEFEKRQFPATITSRINQNLGFRVTGKVLERLVDVGQAVKAGDILATLEPTDFRLQMEQARAELEAAKENLETASAAKQRNLALHRSGNAPQSLVDTTTSAAQEAASRLARAQLAVKLAENALSYTTLKADADGVVTGVALEQGNVVAAGQSVLQLASMGELEASVSLPESFQPDSLVGHATLTLWAYPAQRYKVKLREFSPSADATTRTFQARFSILNIDRNLRLGMSATLTISPADATPVARVPLSSLFDQGSGIGLWRVDPDGRLTLVPAKVLRYEISTALIAAALKEGDLVVALGVQKLAADTRVRVVEKTQ